MKEHCILCIITKFLLWRNYWPKAKLYLHMLRIYKFLSLKYTKLNVQIFSLEISNIFLLKDQWDATSKSKLTSHLKQQEICQYIINSFCYLGAKIWSRISYQKLCEILTASVFSKIKLKVGFQIISINNKFHVCKSYLQHVGFLEII